MFYCVVHLITVDTCLTISYMKSLSVCLESHMFSPNLGQKIAKFPKLPINPYVHIMYEPLSPGPCCICHFLPSFLPSLQNILFAICVLRLNSLSLYVTNRLIGSILTKVRTVFLKKCLFFLGQRINLFRYVFQIRAPYINIHCTTGHTMYLLPSRGASYSSRPREIFFNLHRSLQELNCGVVN